MRSFDFRGYEIHSSRMWQQAQVDLALEFMKRNDMNALIFHENDLVTQLVFPEKYFDNDIMWENWPVRRQGVLYRRDYLNLIIRKAKSFCIDFYLEIKEIDMVDAIFEIMPELRNQDGTICPNHPFWLEFLDVKFKELFEYYPGIAGIIVSLGTRESPVSIAANRCNCKRCKNTVPVNWYINVLRAMFTPIHAAGKDLIVRDFAYTALQQSMMIKACMEVSKDIIIALKAQPHDYYPTFPTNPEIGNTGELREYIEFDTWGQYFGMGVSPMSLVEDIKERLDICHQKGAVGVWFRTDWELVPDASVHASLSLVNLYAGAMLSKNLDTDLDQIYKTWVDEGLYSPMKPASYIQYPEHPSNPRAYLKLKDFMKASWKAFAKVGYIRGHQYLESDQPPYTLEKAFEIMVVIHSRDDWDEGASARVSVTDENMEVIFEEKKQGILETKALYEILDVESLGVSPEFSQDLTNMLDSMVLFAEFCDIITRSMYLTKKACMEHTLKSLQTAEAVVEELEHICKVIKMRMEHTYYPYFLYSRLHPQRIRQYTDDIKKHLYKKGRDIDGLS